MKSVWGWPKGKMHEKRTKAWTNPTSYRRLEDDHLDGDNDNGEEGDGDHGDQDTHIVQEDLMRGNTQTSNTSFGHKYGLPKSKPTSFSTLLFSCEKKNRWNMWVESVLTQVRGWVVWLYGSSWEWTPQQKIFVYERKLGTFWARHTEYK